MNKNLLEIATKRWNLTQLKTIYEHPTKAVFTAESGDYGPVVLKMDHSGEQLQSEYEMLLQLEGKCSCKVYAFDKDNGLLLEERILPGNPLRSCDSLKERIFAFGQVFDNIHMLAGEGETYLNWLERACLYCEENLQDTYLTQKAQLAYSFCKEIFTKYKERFLLHGDLHHDNLLQKYDGSYAMIDPKGVIGPAILDLPRFLLNEMDTKYDCTDAEHMEKCVQLFAERFGFPAEDIRKVFVMEAILANVWCIEDGETVSESQMKLAEYFLRKIGMQMNLTIKRMAPELAEDYFDFFDNRAFSDNSPYYPCYCNAFNMTPEQIKTEFFEQIEANGGGTEGLRISIRKSAERMVAEGVIQGYLAYDDNVSIGWCNANDKSNYVRVGEFNLDDITDENENIAHMTEDGSEKIKSIVCFEIAPAYRGKGIATALLNRVCDDAAKDGYDKVEVYPVIHTAYEPLDFTGPIHLYEKAGFVRVAEQGKMLVMQKALR